MISIFSQSLFSMRAAQRLWEILFAVFFSRQADRETFHGFRPFICSLMLSILF